jgi:hypothetical protein
MKRGRIYLILIRLNNKPRDKNGIRGTRMMAELDPNPFTSALRESIGLSNGIKRGRQQQA